MSENDRSGTSGERVVRILYAKLGTSRFISSRYLAVVLERALRRIDFPFVFTQGFHPRPRMRFCPSLPVGIAGTNEFFDVVAREPVDPASLRKRANPLLPPAMRFISCRSLPAGADGLPSGLMARYRIEKTSSLNAAALAGVGRIAAETENDITVEVCLNRFNHAALRSAAGGGYIERTLVYDEEDAGRI